MSATLDEWKAELRHASAGWPNNSALQSRLTEFDAAFSAAEMFASYAQFTDEAISELIHHNSEGKVLRLVLDALPHFHEAHQQLRTVFEERWQRFSQADQALTALRQSPPPVPGSNEWQTMANRAREAEAVRTQMTQESGALYSRLDKCTDAFLSQVRRGMARIAKTAFDRYAKLERARLAELSKTIQLHAAEILQSIRTYEGWVTEVEAGVGRRLDLPSFVLPRNALAELAASPDPRLEERPAERAATPEPTNAGWRRGFAGLLSGTR